MLYSVESAHALLKRYITSSQGDLLTTWLQIQQAVSTQIQNIKAIAAKERIQTPLHLNRLQYQACFGHITWLSKLEFLYQRRHILIPF